MKLDRAPGVSYKCPLCGCALYLNQSSYQCEQQHSFDIAKEGYVNLLPVQNKKSRAPGDDKQMLLSRRRFLQAGYYSALAENIVSLLGEQTFHLLDMGCGEGYYLSKLRDHHSHLQLHGVDIAKEGARLAAKRKIDARVAVASTAQLPYFDNSFDALLSIFSPYSLAELERCLRPGGRFIQVGPGPNHLQELAALVYGEFQAHKGNPANLTMSKKWQGLSEKTLAYSAQVQGDVLSDLLAMTPYFWSSKPAKQQEIAKLESLRCSLEFAIHVYQLK